jgi:hypothetical protein
MIMMMFFQTIPVPEGVVIVLGDVSSKGRERP